MAANSIDEPDDEPDIVEQPVVADARSLPYTPEALFSMKNVLSDLMEFLPIYTLSNFMRTFSDYEYGEFEIIKNVYKEEAWMNYHLYWSSWQKVEDEEGPQTESLVLIRKWKLRRGPQFERETKIRKIRKKHEPVGQQTRIRSISQLIEAYKGCMGLAGFDELRETMDSIGLNDLINIKGLFNDGTPNRHQSKEFTTALFCIVFLWICLPIDKQMEHVVWVSRQEGHMRPGNGHDQPVRKPMPGGWTVENCTFTFMYDGIAREITRRCTRPYGM